MPDRNEEGRTGHDSSATSAVTAAIVRWPRLSICPPVMATVG